jgi:outer membrane protein TolC
VSSDGKKGEQLAQAYETARFESDHYEAELVPGAQRAYELHLTKYQAMAQAYSQVIVSQRTLFQ